MDGTTTAERVAALRRFDRFYTDAVGALRSGLLDTPYNLTEARVLYELAQRGTASVADLRRDLDVDAGYLSRILRRFAADGLAETGVSARDGRRREVRLTAPGRRAFGELNRLSDRRARRFLGALAEADQDRLLGAMETIENVLKGRPRADLVVLRPPRPGDYGWVIRANAEVYADEFGWDGSYEALVRRIVSDYANNHDPRREAAWIAEVDGAPVGCVFCVRADDETAQLRLLLVDPSARGLGIGGRLVDECLRFARPAGYRRMRLWTNSVLADARRIYERAGFTLTSEEEHHSFGHDLVGQIWETDLAERGSLRADKSFQCAQDHGYSGPVMMAEPEPRWAAGTARSSRPGPPWSTPRCGWSPSAAWTTSRSRTSARRPTSPPRTFFNYFASKDEAIIDGHLADHERHPRALRGSTRAGCR